MPRKRKDTDHRWMEMAIEYMGPVIDWVGATEPVPMPTDQGIMGGCSWKMLGGEYIFTALFLDEGFWMSELIHDGEATEIVHRVQGKYLAEAVLAGLSEWLT